MSVHIAVLMKVPNVFFEKWMYSHGRSRECSQWMY
jgi:hypothetical protein